MEHLVPGIQERKKERVLPGALSLADRSPTPIREKTVSFGSGQQQDFDKNQPVQQMRRVPAAAFPPHPPATNSQSSQPGNAKQRRYHKFLELAKKWQNKGGPAPWHANQSSKGKSKGKQKSKQGRGKGGKKGKGKK